MAKLSKTVMGGSPEFNETVYSTPERTGDVAFDSTFIKNTNPAQNCVLRINLRIFYRQINPYQLTSPVMRDIAASLGLPIPATGTVGVYGDADDTPKYIKEWTSSDWAAFIAGVNRQAALWNGRFWLKPPDDFSMLDVADGGKRKTRPKTLECYVQLRDPRSKIVD